MSLVKEYALRCDNCGWRQVTTPYLYETAKKARAAARRHGWKRVPGSTRVGKDICNLCVPKYPEAR